MKTLKIYGENHFDDEGDKARQDQFTLQARNGSIILLMEGGGFSLPPVDNVYGVECSLLLSLGSILKNYANLLQAIQKLHDANIRGDAAILNVFPRLPGASQAKLFYIVRSYINDVISLCRLAFTHDKMQELLIKYKIENKVKIALQAHALLFTDAGFDSAIATKTYNIQFLRAVLEIRSELDSVLKRVSSFLLFSIKTVYHELSNNPLLTEERLVLFFDSVPQLAALTGDDFYNEVVMTARNKVFVKNILSILSATHVNEIRFNVGDAHLVGLKDIFDNTAANTRNLDLTIEYYPKDPALIMAGTRFISNMPVVPPIAAQDVLSASASLSSPGLSVFGPVGGISANIGGNTEAAIAPPI
ncbi:MAG: hypothetical protein V4496_06180 [Pseudomonadota bacterium]